MTVKDSDRVRIYEVIGGEEADGASRYYACYRPTGRSTYLGTDADGYTIWKFVIRGRFLKYEEIDDGKYGDRELAVFLVDAKLRRVLHAWIFGQYRSDQLPPRPLTLHGERLRGDGAYAFLVGGADANVGGPRFYEVHLAHGDARMIARSEAIDSASFDASGAYITWREGETQRSVPFH